MRRELQPKSPTARRMAGAKARRKAQEPDRDELPLAHDAATWEEDTFETGWDDEEARIAGELAPNDDD